MDTLFTALVTKQGTAASETALCNLCEYETDAKRRIERQAANDPLSDIDWAEGWTDCPGNWALECQECGRKAAQ